MRCLLDTQVMLWWLLDDPRLGAESRDLLASRPCLVSVASIWEVAIKHRIGKLEVSPIVFRDQSIAAGADLLPVLDPHVIETAQLPILHQDPFDRLLIAQARVEGLMAVSSDGQWSGYDVSLHRL
ncbi:type II toxin-antitoxin system VapC family toxin [Synechococcus sp. ROS8604]|uniref:type II toxin-antitoxin system VapC family toxin n=1 Tax=Synechococcus sp. ROS8604 TaxID=1442557 RepID=UPI001645D940|nr:type II toxin-antitoxin system VapC family toxin [Synechococcus sp. ROS8604]QNI87008.1 putative pilT protein/ N-terminal [Synechococcus sp. ROS8604]